MTQQPNTPQTVEENDVIQALTLLVMESRNEDVRGSDLDRIRAVIKVIDALRRADMEYAIGKSVNDDRNNQTYYNDDNHEKQHFDKQVRANLRGEQRKRMKERLK